MRPLDVGTMRNNRRDDSTINNISTLSLPIYFELNFFGVLLRNFLGCKKYCIFTQAINTLRDITGSYEYFGVAHGDYSRDLELRDGFSGCRSVSGQSIFPPAKYCAKI